MFSSSQTSLSVTLNWLIRPELLQSRMFQRLTVVAQDHWRSRLSRCHGKGLECAAAGDHVAAVAGGIQACTEDGTVPQIIRQRKLSATAVLTLQL